MSKKRFENVFELNYVEDLKQATETALGIQFNSIHPSRFEHKIIRDNGFTKTVTAKPFIGLRQNNEPVLGFRIRSKSLADSLLEVLHNIMAEKNPVVDESIFTPQVTYHDSEPDWEYKYKDLVKALINESNSVFRLGHLLHQLKRDHPDLVEEVNNENQD